MPLLHAGGVATFRCCSRSIGRLRLTLLAASVMLTARGDAVVMEAPAHRFAAGFEEPAGLAVDLQGAVLVTDRKAGTLTRVLPHGTRQTVLQNLDRPGALAVDRRGVVLIAESDARVLALDPDGVLSVAVADAKRPRAIAVGPDGRVWLLVRAGGGPHFDLVRLDAPGVVKVIASGFRNARGLAVDRFAAYVAFASVAPGGSRYRTTVGRLRLDADGRPGPLEPLLHHGVVDAHGLAIDAAGDLFISGTTDGADPGLIMKRRSGGALSILSAAAGHPRALAFAPDGSLFAIDAGAAAVVVLRAPAAPRATLPAFTNATPLRVSGTAQPGSLVQIYTRADARTPAAAALADGSHGGFAVDVDLERDDETRMLLVATAAGGAGLRGAMASGATVHDSHLPTVSILQPRPGIHIRDAVAARVTAADAASGVAEIRVLVDDAVVAVVQNGESGASMSSTVSIGSGLAEGPHSLMVAATDRAGNAAGAAQLFVVDRTPPDTHLIAAPGAESPGPGATFTFGGWDAQSPGLEFSWRLDTSGWSAFSEAATVEFTTLQPGPHRFEVRARDHAGNEDPTPAAQAFTVTALRIRLLEPEEGAVVTSGTVWVRGTLEAAGQAVAVTVPLDPALQQAPALDVLRVPAEAGMFAAEVPVVPGMTTVSVVARTADGTSATATVSISVQGPPSPATKVEAVHPAGFAPHVVRFPTAAFPAGSVYSMDIDSDGTPEYEGTDLWGQELVYRRPGIYVAALHVVPPGGGPRASRAVIEVYDRAALDARLQAVWNAFRQALRGGDIAAAAAFVHSERRPPWQQHLARLTPEQLAATDAVFTEMALVEVAPGRAECEMLRDVGGLLYSFPIAFAVDIDGGWRLWQF